jgi:hypothetical protein
VAKGGEDAWFINIAGDAFGLADGVGGYDQYGVDSGLYSKQFMQLALAKDAEQVRPSPQRGVGMPPPRKQSQGVSKIGS